VSDRGRMGTEHLRVFAWWLGLVLASAAVHASPFSDVPDDHWALPAIKKCIAYNIAGAPEKFGGTETIDRFQMAALVNNLLSKIEGMRIRADEAQEFPPVTRNDVQALHARVASLQEQLKALRERIDNVEHEVRAMPCWQPKAR